MMLLEAAKGNELGNAQLGSVSDDRFHFVALGKALHKADVCSKRLGIKMPRWRRCGVAPSKDLISHSK